MSIIGIREREKKHETLVTREELMKAEDNTFENTRRLDLEQTIQLIKSLEKIRDILKWKKLE